MPVYEYYCKACSQKFDAFKKLADYSEPQFHTCGEVAEKRLSLPMISVDYPAYQSPATGKWITGRKEHEEDLRRSNCRILEPGESAGFESKKKAEDAKFEASIDATVEGLFSECKGVINV